MTSFHSNAAPPIYDDQSKCKKGCELVFLTVPYHGQPGKRVVRDKKGQCWKNTFVLVATEDPNRELMQASSDQTPIECEKTPE